MCEESRGFERRMLQKTVAAGVCGLGLGAMMAFRVPKQQRTLALALKSSLTSALSLSMLSFTFSGAQEYTRALTCQDTPVNAAVGGAAAGALLFTSHGGNPVLGAAIVAALGCSADLVFRKLNKVPLPGDQQAMSREGSEGFMARIFRKTTEEERIAFLEQRRKRIQRETD